MKMKISRKDAQRFWEKIDTNWGDFSVCWEWKGKIDSTNNRGRITIKGRQYYPGYIMLECFGDGVPINYYVHRTCRNLSCVNPIHLFLSTRKNIQRNSLEDRFWNKVNIDRGNKCWEWNGSKQHEYGQISSPSGKTLRAHRVSWELHYGKIPRGKWVLHRCDNPSCVNPEHLFLGDNFINTRDKTLKERQIKGEQCPISKLKNADVLEIRSLYSLGEHSQKELGNMFNVGRSTISLVVNRKTWKHI